jgi:GTP-binding protein
MPLEIIKAGITETMKFVDEARIWVKAGDGGKGCVSFGREKFIPKGKADGGDGGRGGDILLVADPHKSTLLDFSFQRRYQAENGEPGGKRKRFGRRGSDVVIGVPMGTAIRDVETQAPIQDFTLENQRFVVAKGGRGGRGNARFVSSTNRSPSRAQEGRKGERRWLNLELKLLADVALIGYPNVGKSTLMARISSARPKIADYPFTTTIPNLGAAKCGEFRQFVVGDLPGLVKGAHRGAGLGVRFLRHIERANLVIHLIDISDPCSSDPIEGFRSVNREMEAYSPSLLDKNQVVALNKIDLKHVRGRIRELKERFAALEIPLFPISAATGEGVEDLMREVIHRVDGGRSRGV